MRGALKQLALYIATALLFMVGLFGILALGAAILSAFGFVGLILYLSIVVGTAVYIIDNLL